MADDLRDICTDWQRNYGTDPAFGAGQSPSRLLHKGPLCPSQPLRMVVVI